MLVDDLAVRFDVTPQTIRKDLNELCDERLLARTHGGAMLSSGVENVAYEARRQLAARGEGGDRPARRATHSQQLFAVHQHRHDNRGSGARAGSSRRTAGHHQQHSRGDDSDAVPKIDVIVVGGMLRKTDGGIVGEAAVDFITQFKVDYAVIGASAIDDDGAMLDFDYREVRAAKAIMNNARNVILVSDAMKFTRSAPVRIGHIVRSRCVRHRPAAAGTGRRNLPPQRRAARNRR